MPTNKVDKRKGPMDADHKANLMAGRARAATVKQYLKALPDMQRLSKTTEKELREQLATAQAAADNSDDLTRLEHLQRVHDLEDQIIQLDEKAAFDDLTDQFIGIAAEYSEVKGIDRRAWRDYGVPASVLDRAGIR